MSSPVDAEIFIEDPRALLHSIRIWARDLGFQQIGVTDVDLAEHEAYLQSIERLAAPRKSRPYRDGNHTDLGLRLRTTAIMSVAAIGLLILASVPFTA